MRLLLARHLARSPWMNPARWSHQPASVIDTAAQPDGWWRDQYDVLLTSGPGCAVAAERARAAVLAYRIFPPERLIAALPGMTVAPGAVVVQGIRLGPLGLITAVRVMTVFDRERDGQRRTGFSYVTLAGHPERGMMTCAVVEDARAGTLRFEIDALSRPGHWLTRLTAPLARRLQQASARAALAHMVAQAQAAPPGSDQPPV